jgi:hypothetical protein
MHYGLTDAQYPAAHTKIHPILVAAASRGVVTAYSELVARVRVVHMEPDSQAVASRPPRRCHGAQSPRPAGTPMSPG